MGRNYPFHQVDVFSKEPLRGNPLAVVHDAGDLDEATMAAFARWTNLSETTFLMPPTTQGADYRVRIFTPAKELPFAGHPTLGSCHAWLMVGGKPRFAGEIVQECGVGLIRIRKEGDKLAFAAPPLRRTGPLDDEVLEQIVTGLGIHREDIVDHQWVDNGPSWCGVVLRSADQVLSIKPDLAVLRQLKVGVIAPQPAGSDTDFEVRAFPVAGGIVEDPVTGSLNAGLAMWLINEGLAPEHYVVAQGTAMDRRGRVFVDKVGDTIWIGGDVAICVEGSVNL